ncbi:MAG: InlB B-repeat-containing protein [Spirochaetales bacterium]|nr:InlB B-repeat-containing protein [Spirochaetales bacterium]
MRKAFTIILAALLLLSVFVSCNQDDLVDDLFNSSVHVTFDSNGGSGSMAVQEMKGRTATALSANAFTKEGYLFLEWSTKADGSGTAYADGQSVSLDSDITLYAQWIDTSSIIQSSTTQLNNGTMYSIVSDVTVTERLVVNGSVTINLPAGRTLTVPKGIRVSEGNSLTITGTSTLIIAETEDGKAGIGGNEDENCGTVIIKSGTVTVTGGNYGAGIGSGMNGAGGTIIISGGTVNATGGTDAAGIGAGKDGTVGTITISDEANVTTAGGKALVFFKANGGTGTMNPQVMNKNTETALSANAFTRTKYVFNGWNTKADGSGTAYADGASVSLDWDITLYAQWVDESIITSSTTELTSDIGDYKLLDDVTINSRVTVTGTVSINLAEGKTLTIPKGIQVSEGNSLTINGKGRLSILGTEDYNAGIGGNKNENCGTVIIEGGSIVARGAVGAAGIGGGKAETAGGNGGTITINGGEVRAMGALGSPGIGSGTNNSGASVSGGSITITGGTVHVATGANSAAIGGGTNADSGTITINGGTVGILCDVVTTTIGAGLGGTNGDITISDDVNILSDGAGPGNDKVLVVFKANGGEGTIVPMIMNKNTETALPANTFTKTDYVFNGWNTKADGTGTAYANGASVSLDSDTTLYAQW